VDKNGIQEKSLSNLGKGKKEESCVPLSISTTDEEDTSEEEDSNPNDKIIERWSNWCPNLDELDISDELDKSNELDKIETEDPLPTKPVASEEIIGEIDETEDPLLTKEKEKLYVLNFPKRNLKL
jgi:hypothetical protein